MPLLVKESKRYLENLVEDARDRRGMRLTKSQVIELLLNTVDYFDDIMGAIYSKK
ncbi:TPA: CopG family transcriptional regulator [Streptococcus pneumoniae]